MKFSDWNNVKLNLNQECFIYQNDDNQNTSSGMHVEAFLYLVILVGEN